MSECTLLLRLEAPLQSWGIGSKFDIRRTEREPSKSGVIGLVAAAMGLRRDADEQIARLSAMRFGVRIDKEGKLLRDYQTVRKQEKNEKVTSYVTYRYYLADACFTVGLESDDRELLLEIEDSLKHPAFPLFLGKRSCPPVGKICQGIVELSLEEALRTNISSKETMIRLVLELKQEQISQGIRGAILRDQPISFDPRQRKFTFRQAQEEYIRGETNSTEHDAMQELEVG